MLAPGDRLPSIRALADSLHVSHITVEQAYGQLCSEGFASNVPRSGFFVNDVDTELFQLVRTIPQRTAAADVYDDLPAGVFDAEARQGIGARYDFSFTRLPEGSFPRSVWAKAASRSVFGVSDLSFTNYPIGRSPNNLQVQIAAYIGQTRGVRCTPEQVLVCSGTSAVLARILQLFDPAKHSVCIEEPGYDALHFVAGSMGFKTTYWHTEVPSSQYGASLHEALGERPKIVFTTPSHQFPTGQILGLEDRINLIRYAERSSAFIIEDDSCAEYRFDQRSIPSLQSLDAYGRVIYMNNFSKTLSPALRVSYAVLPPRLMGRYRATFLGPHEQVPLLTQETLARMMEGGDWGRHVRRVVQHLRRRHDILYRELLGKLGDIVSISGAHSGMHLCVVVDNGMDTDRLRHTALEQGANVYSTNAYWFERRPQKGMVLIGFSGVPEKDIVPGVDALRRAWVR